MKSLRDQIKDIASRRVNPTYAEQVDFPATVDHLAAAAFVEQWEEGTDTRAVRKAYIMLHASGVPYSVPAVE